MKTLFGYIILMIALLFTSPAIAQKNSKSNKDSLIEAKIKNKDFVFVATWVTPLTWPMKQLTDYYDLRIHHDSLTAYLPFYGRAYAAPKDLSDASIDFTSTKFTYTVTKQKKGGWQIDIEPALQDDIQSFTITVYGDGVAYLNIISIN